jgi:glutamate synthase domain-containing protein 2
MMNEWGIPTIYLQSLANEFVAKLAKGKIRVPDLAIAGGFSDEAHIFKALALGAPNFKAVCMGRALMIPGMVGKKWGRLKFGKDVENLPLGAVGIFTATQKIRTGLQQLLAGATATSICRRSGAAIR